MANLLKIRLFVVGVFVLAILASLTLWILTKKYGDAVFLNLCSIASLTLLLRSLLQQRTLNCKEWIYLKVTTVLSSLFYYHCGNPLAEASEIEFLFGFIVFQWFIYFACISLNIVLEKNSLILKNVVLRGLPLCLGIYIALLKVQLLELDVFHQIFFSSWFDLIISVQGIITLTLAVGISSLVIWLLYIVSHRKMKIWEGGVILALLVTLCSQAHPRFMLFPLFALPGFSLSFLAYLNSKFSRHPEIKKQINYGIFAVLWLFIGLIIGDGWIIIPISIHLLLSLTIFFSSNLKAIVTRKNKLIYTSLFVSSIFTLLWVGMWAVKGVDKYETEVNIISDREEVIIFHSNPSLNTPVKLLISCSYDKEIKTETGSSSYQYLKVGLANSTQKKELLKLGNTPFKWSSPDYHQKWSRGFLGYSDLSFGRFRKAFPPALLPNRRNIVKIYENVWFDTKSRFVYKISDIENY